MPDLSPDLGVPAFRTKPVSFVRRSARLTAAQQRAWDEHRADYLIEVPRAVAGTSVHPEWVLDVEGVYGRTAPLVVEIGSGLGDNIVEAAAREPGRDFLAVEVYTPGLAQTIVKAQQRSEGAGLPNLRLLQVNAAELVETGLAAGTVDELWVFFPDPWHKSRHHKRRLVKDEFADLAARVLRPGGVWRLATDWAEYAEQMLAVGDASAHFRNAHQEGNVAPRFDGRVMTAFERKGLAAGRHATDLEFIKR